MYCLDFGGKQIIFGISYLWLSRRSVSEGPRRLKSTQNSSSWILCGRLR